MTYLLVLVGTLDIHTYASIPKTNVFVIKSQVVCLNFQTLNISDF